MTDSLDDRCTCISRSDLCVSCTEALGQHDALKQKLDFMKANIADLIDKDVEIQHLSAEILKLRGMVDSLVVQTDLLERQLNGGSGG